LINLVTGGAGFIGSHIIDYLLKKNEEIICIDNLLTGNRENLDKWGGDKNFTYLNHDIVNPIDLKVNKIWHLACPASPIHYQKDPIYTSKILFQGTLNVLNIAYKNNAKLLIASSSEIYGNPTLHPQVESYFGNVNNIGIRSCYEEGKRMAESLCYDFQRAKNINLRIARIFNTYGPGMLVNDGRVMSNFVCQALQKKSLTIYGDGSQTRSFCYISDMVKGLIKLMDSDYNKPINIGSEMEMKIIDLASLIINNTYPDLKIDFHPEIKDDPLKRKPNIDIAKNVLGWNPTINIQHGLSLTIDYFKNEINKHNI
tara:strand:+ start:177 stop:1115 length:939 start_codon:yes stop_codon:yes gene_type:complete